MKNIKNKNGFTLIELLAVIVILAVLILLALPNVLRTMEEARQNAFKVEVQEILKQVETAYSMESMKGNVVGLTAKAGTRYLCMDLEELYEKGYSNKNFEDMGYTGFAEVFVPSDGKAVFGINISNGVLSYLTATPDALQQAVSPLTEYTEITSKCVKDSNKKLTGAHVVEQSKYGTINDKSAGVGVN